MTTTYDVFLSHNSADKETVELIARHLREEAQLHPFLDHWHLVPGEPWQEALEQALDSSRACAVFLGPAGLGTWENEEMRAALDIRVARPDFRVIPVLLPGARLPERGRLPRFLARLTWVDFRPGLDDARAFHEMICGIQGIAPGPEVITEVEIACPFRGLRVFDEEHARFFFGREPLTQHLVEQLREDRFLVVIGPSGSGKSSLVRAGLVPQIRCGALPASDGWPILLFKPGPHPLETLAARLLPHLGAAPDPLAARASLLDVLRKDERGLHSAVQVALASAPDSQRLLLVVDQFEELFTLCRDESARAGFIANLLYSSAIAGGQTVAVVTMRADFFGKCAAYPDLAARLAERDVLVGPLSEEELRQAMERPAHVVGLHYEKGLVDTILGDLGNEPGTLPLLQHTLLELWERRRGGWLTTDAYREIGGVQGALAQRAETVYAQLTSAQQESTRRVLLRLTQPGEGTEDTRRRATLTELLPAEGKPADVEVAVRELADARLLITGKDERGNEIVDVAHEALIRGWPRLREWIDEDRATLRIHRRLTEAANEWTQRNRDGSYLYHGDRLAEAEKIARTGDLSVMEREFVQASKKAHRRRTASRVVTISLALLLLISIGIVIRQIQRSISPWQPVAGFPSDPVLALAVTNESSPTHYAGTDNIGVGRSKDGITWTLHRQGLPTAEEPAAGKDMRAIGPLAVDVRNPQRVFAFVAENGIYKSEDAGETWQAANAGLPGGYVIALAARGSLVLAVFDRFAGHSLYASLDSGASWELVSGQGEAPLDNVYSVYIAPGADRVCVGTERGLYSSPIGPPWAWEQIAELTRVLIIEPEAGNSGSFYLAAFNIHQEQGDIHHWRPGEDVQWLATVNGYPFALAPHPNATASVATYVLLQNGEVLAVTGEGQTKSLGRHPGPGFVYDLLAVSHPANEDIRLLLGHDDGLLEYRGTLDVTQR